MMDQYGVMGCPIQHSWSPRIHQLFAKQTNQSLVYRPILVPPDQLEQALHTFQTEGGKGLNITLPFKQQAYELIDKLSERAQLAQAVNTIRFDPDGSLFGDNTDGIGFIRDVIHHHQFPISDKRVLILGAGGAARGILGPILQESPALLVIANRTEANANALAAAFSSYHESVQACALSALTKFEFDLIINATSASLTDAIIELPVSLLGKQAYCYDMMYGKEPTPFMKWAQKHHVAIVSDGLGMLVEQAAESFYIWRGVRPDTQPVLEILRL